MAINTDVNVHSVVMCANFLVRKEGKYLFLKRSSLKKVAPNFLHIPGGKIDSAEDPLLAAQRELWEEAGLKATNIRLEAVVTDIPHPASTKYQNVWLVYYFSGDYESGELLTTEEGELVWLTIDQIDKEKMFPSTKEIIDSILDPNAGVVFGRFVYDQDDRIVERHVSICEK